QCVRPGEVSEQLAETGLGIGDVDQRLRDDGAPAAVFPVLVGAPGAVAVDVVLTTEGVAEPCGNLCRLKSAAEAASDGGIYGGGRRVRVDQRADGVEEHGAGCGRE